MTSGASKKCAEGFLIKNNSVLVARFKNYISCKIIIKLQNLNKIVTVKTNHTQLPNGSHGAAYGMLYHFENTVTHSLMFNEISSRDFPTIKNN